MRTKLAGLCFILLTSFQVADASERDTAFLLSRVRLATVEPYRCALGKSWDLTPRFAFAFGNITNSFSRTFAERPQPEWQFIYGKVFQIADDGLLLHRFKEQDITMSGDTELVFVKHCPFAPSLVDDAPICLYAVEDGPHAYITAGGFRKTVKGYDFGTAPSLEQLQALKAEAKLREADDAAVTEIRRSLAAHRNSELAELSRQRSQEADRRVLQFTQEQARAGSGLYQFRLGEKYANGTGVAKDLNLARAWLVAACTNGNTQAAALLQELASIRTNSPAFTTK